jgi:fumarate hydratase class I
VAEFVYEPLFAASGEQRPMRRLTGDHVKVLDAAGRTVLEVEPAALELLAFAAFDDVSHLLRAEHLAQLRKILDDPEASANDRFVALELLKNANIAAGRELPGCQDTGTAIILGRKGEQVWTRSDDKVALSRGVFRCYQERNLRFSQMAPLAMFQERNTGTNLPADISIEAAAGMEFEFLFIAKGGGSANKTFLFQETRALLEPRALRAFLVEKIAHIGTSACPPYHLALVIGGLSAEQTLKTVKLASCHALDGLPTTGSPNGRAFRDPGLEAEFFRICQESGIGAQFGGKYLAHDVRVIRLPRHGASLPIGLGVSCSADRQAVGRITREGVFLEALETNPARFLPDVEPGDLGASVTPIDLRRPMPEILAALSRVPVGGRVSLSGPMVVARDIAHARLRERVESGQELPSWFRDHAVYYAGPAKTPSGRPSGSFGPTTAGRMDPYVPLFQSLGASLVMLAKGNRSATVAESCRKHGGFYLGSVGGPAARLADHSIKKVEVLDFADLGMEAVWRIEVEDFPAFVVIDSSGRDFYREIRERTTKPGLRV